MGPPHGHQYGDEDDGTEEPLRLGPELAGTEEDRPGDGQAACHAAGQPPDSTQALECGEPAGSAATRLALLFGLSRVAHFTGFWTLGGPGGLR